ncbi:MAG: hypothetical protein KF767_04980 [Bdellovibrionaceae bacterium]|nr:hypothetical protein [Pseudobdellovibrionaceae bacterium]
MKNVVSKIILALFTILPSLGFASGICTDASFNDRAACEERVEAEFRAEEHDDGIAYKTAVSPNGVEVVCEVAALQEEPGSELLHAAGLNYVVTHSGLVSRQDQGRWLASVELSRDEALAVMEQHPVCNGLVEAP